MLSVRDVGKSFRVFPNRWAQLREILTGRPHHQRHWVFQGLSFDVQHGESVGLVGRNGAGKSTLLKLLTGVSHPDTGSIQRQGRISAILELGIGFDGEFTGIENARQSLLQQGLTEAQAQALLPEVEAFAEVGSYFHKPVHTYSSGMQMRLAFSVATAVRPDLLIVDEALAVGDAYFQHKCYERIRTLRDQGAAILMVSHDPSSIRSMCSRALLLDHGRIIEDGPPSPVLETYNLLLAPDVNRQHESAGAAAACEGRRAGSGEVTIEGVTLLQGGQPTHAPVSEVPAELRVRLQVREPVPDLTLGVLVRDRLGNDIFGTNTHHQGLVLPGSRRGPLEVSWQLEGFHLGPGHYSLTVAAHAGAVHAAGNYDWWDRCLTFQVLPAAGPVSIGPASLRVQVACRQEETA